MQCVLLLLVLAIEACSRHPSPVTGVPPAEADRYAVYVAALSYLFPPSTLPRLEVQANTVAVISALSLERTQARLPDLARDGTWQAYREASRTTQPIGAYFTGIQRIALVDSTIQQELRGVPSRGVIWLSGVGFDATMVRRWSLPSTIADHYAGTERYFSLCARITSGRSAQAP